MVCASAIIDAVGRDPNQRITDPNSQCAQILELLRPHSSSICGKHPHKENAVSSLLPTASGEAEDPINGPIATCLLERSTCEKISEQIKVTPQLIDPTEQRVDSDAQRSENKTFATAPNVKRSEVWLQARSTDFPSIPRALAQEASPQPPKDQSLEALRKQAKATLERASRNGSLATLLAKSFGDSRGAKMSAVAAAATAANSSTRDTRDSRALPVRSRRGLPRGEMRTSGEKVEDTRDLEDLLRELGEAPEVEKAKGKKKGKLASNSSSLPVPQHCSNVKTSADKETTPREAVCAQSQQTGSRLVSNDSLDDDTTESFSIPILVAPSAVEPIERKTPVIAPHDIDIRRPTLVGNGAESSEGVKPHQQKKTKLKISSKPVTAEAWLPKTQADCPRSLQSTSRTIPVWPATPESTPPSSPRDNSGEPREVLVPVPIHLVVEVQKLLLRYATPDGHCALPSDAIAGGRREPR